MVNNHREAMPEGSWGIHAPGLQTPTAHRGATFAHRPFFNQTKQSVARKI